MRKWTHNWRVWSSKRLSKWLCVCVPTLMPLRAPFPQYNSSPPSHLWRDGKEPWDKMAENAQTLPTFSNCVDPQTNVLACTLTHTNTHTQLLPFAGEPIPHNKIAEVKKTYATGSEAIFLFAGQSLGLPIANIFFKKRKAQNQNSLSSSAP